jgi:NAD(P)-dependent dehydrogenase (short-subunit alcohol dehydrogenase family)
VEQILKEFGKVDILVNNAGVTRSCAGYPEAVDLVINTNLKGYFWSTGRGAADD